MSEPKKTDFHNVLSWGDEEKELERVQTKFLKLFPPHGKVLDVGSGRGVFLELLRKAGFEAVGVEPDATMYEASTKGSYTVYKQDGLSFLSTTEQKFDGIMASHVIEHMNIDEGVKFLKLIKERLNKNGVAIIITPRPGSLWATENFWLDTTHVRPYPYMLLKQLLSPLEEIEGGIEPDSYALKEAGRKRRFIARVRRLLLGPELFDFVYGGGVWYIAVKKND